MNFKEKLIEYGLSENEAAIYLAAMELGPSPVQKIATKAKVNRVSTYNFIKTLMQKGLMSSFEQGKKTMFVASEPDKIQNFFTSQKRALEDKEKEFNDLLPQFKTIFNATNKPVVRFYEGLDGALTMNDEMLDGNNLTIEGIYNYDLVRENIPSDILLKIREKRKNKNIKTVTVYSDSKGVLASDELNERHIVEDPKYPLLADITLREDKIQFISFNGGIFGIIIENKEITETIRSLMKLAIKGLKK